MAGFTTQNNEHLIRSQIWSTQIKEQLEDELYAMKYVDMITDFPDGDTLNIPSIGTAEVSDYVENQPVKYTNMDTGNFQFTITDYVQSGTYITNKMKQDTFYLSRLVSKFVPSQSRAIMERIETEILDAAVDGQTASGQNTINGADHRLLAQGAGNIISVKDFAYAKYALRKANVPMTNLIAIVDPSIEYTLSTLSTFTDLSFNKSWEGIVRDGMSTGMRFKMNIYGFDVYVSDYLKTGMTETVNSQSATNGVANLFFSAAPDIMPIVGQLRQPPKVDSEYNKDFQREEYVTTARWGFKLYRPENMVVVISETSGIAPAYS